MRDPYRIFVNQNGKFEVVDMRDNPDLTRFIAETTSSWKKVTTAGQRRYYSTDHNIHSRPGTYLLSYDKGPCIAVDPSKGDYIPPGYTRVSLELRELFNGHSGAKCVQRSRLVPMHGSFLINDSLASSRNQFCIYRNRPEKGVIPGWSLYHNCSTYYVYVLTVDGLKCSRSTDTALITQPMAKELLEGRTRLRVRLHAPEDIPESENTNDPLSRAVLLNDTPLTREGDVFTWEGDEPLTEDTLLSIEINGLRTLRRVEVLDD